MQQIVIVGNGISGITCARYIRKQNSEVKITVISAETEYFFARTALMYVYMGHMKFDHIKPYENNFWGKNRIDLVFNFVSKIDTENKQVVCKNNELIKYDKLVLAVGSKTNFFDWPGQDLKGVQGLYNFHDLQTMEENTKEIEHAVIVGGGLIGIELAEMLLSRKINVTFLIREKRFWSGILAEGEARMIERHMKEHHINIMLESELKEIVGDNDNHVKAVVTKNDETISCQFVGISTGVSPNINFLKEGKIKTAKGILVNQYFETNVDDVFAIGDCAQFNDAVKGRKNLEQVWYTGRMHGQILAQTLCGNKTKYNPGPWFNSAKFLDIEYQNYGVILGEAEDDQEFFYWEDASVKIALRAGFDKSTKKLHGINTFGLRLRHDLFDRWLTEERTVEEVLIHLADANFDPEFYRKYESEIITAYNKQYGTNLKPLEHSWNRILQTIKKLQHAGN